MNKQATQIPEGFMENAQGHFVPEHIIKDIDKTRDQVVRDLVEQAKSLREEMTKFKAQVFGDIDAFVELSAEQYNVKLGGKKGNVTLLSFDGRFKIQRSIQENLAFDERLQAAKALIDECLQNLSEGAKPELMVIVNDVFRVDKNGEIRTARVLGLRRHDIKDERWQKAMLIIGEACYAVGSKSYVRFYERVGDTDQYKPISLDIAAL